MGIKYSSAEKERETVSFFVSHLQYPYKYTILSSRKGMFGMAITMSVEEYKQLFGTPEPEDSVEKQIARKQASSQKRSVQSGINNSLGQKFETLISYACDEYKRQGVAYIKKTPEPFRVLCKKGKGQFIGQFGNGQNAQPDYTGTLKGGRSIMCEAKATSKWKC